MRLRRLYGVLTPLRMPMVPATRKKSPRWKNHFGAAAFAPFAGEIAQMSSNIRARYEASPRSANAQALRELADVAGSNDAVDVLCLCLDVADNDGIGEEEEKQLKKIAQALQLPLDQYL